jgi:hypothetical protein
MRTIGGEDLMDAANRKDLEGGGNNSYIGHNDEEEWNDANEPSYN